MADLITLSANDVRGASSTHRQEGAKIFPVWKFDMPPNAKSEKLREGDEVIYNGTRFKVHRKEDLRPPYVSERCIQFWLVSLNPELS